MSMLAPTLQAFFAERLIGQRQASPHTIAAYRDTLRLLLTFAAQHTSKPPSMLDLDDLDAPLIGAFLDHLEHERGNTVRTRNARLAAVRSLFRYAALKHPEHAATIQRVLAIPAKRTDQALVTFLTKPELQALLDAPDQSTWIGRRDHALILLASQTGLRVSELLDLSCGDIRLGAGAHVNCLGKGRKQRITPLTKQTVDVMRAWTANAPPSPMNRCSRQAPAASSAATRSSTASPNTPPPRRPPARHSRPRPLRRTCSVTPQRCACCTPMSTRP